MSDFAYARCGSLPAMFFDQAQRRRDAPFLWRKQHGGWQSQSWGAIADAVVTLAGGLLASGLQPGDRVLLVSENRPEWLIADLAVMSAGGVTVPAYITNSLSDYRHLLNNCSARFAIISSRVLAEKVIGAALSADFRCSVITIEPLNLRQDAGLPITNWQEVMALGSDSDEDILARVAMLNRGDLACLIYTSGTGGAPRGVMLSHGAILSNCHGAFEVLFELGLGDEVFLCFLPLSHAYEHLGGLFFPVSVGAQIYYAESIDQLAANMADVHPTIMTAVPRLYETMRGRILSALQRQGGLKARLFDDAVRIGSKRYRDPASLTLWERLYDLLLDRAVRTKVAERFGGRLKALVSGGAPLNFEVGLFFTALGIRILQGYGQTEAAPLISVNPAHGMRLDSVGKAVHGVELRIAEDGEILVRGEGVMLGYWNDVEGTARAIQQGWLHTGDVGHVDGQGYIYITDRKKDIIVNSGGDNVSPQRVEGFLALQPEIAQGMVYGDRRPHLVALLVPDPDFAKAWAQKHNRPGDLHSLVRDGEFRRQMGDAVDRVNQHLSSIEKIRRFTLLAEPFTTDNEMATPTLKLRRHVIIARYGELLANLYEGRNSPSQAATAKIDKA